MLDAWIYDGLRTPFGRHGGALAPVRPDDLLAVPIRALVDRSPFAPSLIEDVVIGCANQAGEDSRCVARHVGLLAGLPIESAGQVIQRNCGSGLSAIVTAAHALTCGECDVMIAGGVESMSRAPFVVGKAEQAYSRQFNAYDSALGARFPNPRIEAAFGADTMVETADNLAREFQISREDCDRFAAASQAKYARARNDGFFRDEIVPVTLPAGRGQAPKAVSEDEHPRPASTSEALAKLKPLQTGGVTTAGGSSGINDGAAALIIGTRAAGERTDTAPRARIVAAAVAGVPPRVMGLGPVPAARKVLKRAGLTLNDMDVIEINEAFAAQVLACLKELNVSFDDGLVNPNGGAIAIGHPLGASGPRLALTAMRELEHRRGRYALVALCIGIGQGVAIVLERQPSA